MNQWRDGRGSVTVCAVLCSIGALFVFFAACYHEEEVFEVVCITIIMQRGLFFGILIL